jgi:hypothetical protein
MARGFRGRVAVGAALVACALVPAAAGAAENGLIYIEASSPISSGQPAAPLANCPEDAHLVGAGGDSLVGVVPGLINSVTPFDDDDEDLKPDDGAYAYAFNTTASPGTTQAWAVCARGKTIYRSQTSKLRVNHAATVKARCPGDMSVVGGGNYITGSNDDATLQATRPFDGHDANHNPDDGWRVKAFNLRELRKDLTAYAICRKPSEHPRYLGGFGSMAPGSAGGGGAECNNVNRSVAGPGAEIKGEPSLVRLAGYFPEDNTIEAGDQPDDYVSSQAENATTGEVRFGSFAACLNLAP